MFMNFQVNSGSGNAATFQSSTAQLWNLIQIILILANLNGSRGITCPYLIHLNINLLYIPNHNEQ